MKKRFPPPSHRPIPTRDKKQKRQPSVNSIFPKRSRRQKEEIREDELKKEKKLIQRAKREKLVAIDWVKMRGFGFGRGHLGVETLEGKYYLDMPFHCVDCRGHQIWTGRQQQWWYEVAGGAPPQVAIRCRDCRIKERARRDQARTVHLEGVERKKTTREGMKNLKNRKRKRPGSW